MKSIFITICFLILVSISFGQKIKTVDIWKNVMKLESLYVIYSYDENDTLSSTEIVLNGLDHKYRILGESTTLFSGDPEEFYKFLNDIEAFRKENEANTSTKINRQRVLLCKDGSVCVDDVKGVSYHYYTPKDLAKLKTKFVDWCKKNNVAYE